MFSWSKREWPRARQVDFTIQGLALCTALTTAHCGNGPGTPAPSSSGGTSSGGGGASSRGGSGTTAASGAPSSGGIAGGATADASAVGGSVAGTAGGPASASAGATSQSGEGGVSLTMCGGTAETVSDAHPNPYPLTGWAAPATAGGVDRAGNCAAGAAAKSLPGTGLSYCVKADASCSAASGSCPLYVNINQGGTRSYFDRVADSTTNGAFIAVLLDSLADGNDVKDAFAELPRVIAHDYAGLDRQRVYAVGFSAGSGAITRALCHIAKGSDGSRYGSTSDIYTALAFGGAPCGCNVGFEPPSGAGSSDILSVTGDKDEFNQGDGGEHTLRNRAFVSGCTEQTNLWRGVASDDAYVLGEDGSCAVVKKLSFGTCPGGDVVGYEFSNWPHDSRYPGNQFEDIAWRFFQGRRKR